MLLGIEARGDVEIYHGHIERAFEGANPYEGKDAFGYPPLAFIFVALPYVAGGRSSDAYYQLYRAQCYAVDALAFYLLTRSVRKDGYLLAYVLGTAVLGNLLYHRLDIALGLLLILVVHLHDRGRWLAAHAFLGLSMAFKVIPIVLVPAALALEARRSWRRSCLGSLMIVMGAGAPTAVGYLAWGAPSVFFLGDHAERGVQLESTWASVELLLMEMGALRGAVYWGAGSHNLHTVFEAAIVRWSHVLTGIVALGGVGLAFATPRGNPAPAFAATLGGCLAASKVFSPQFLLFLFPLCVVSAERGRRPEIAVLLILVSALTTWVYPYHEQALVALDGVAVAPLILRNALFLALTVALYGAALSRNERER